MDKVREETPIANPVDAQAFGPGEGYEGRELDKEPTEPEKVHGGRIVVTFHAPYSANADVHVDPDIGPMQVLGVAEVLRMQGESMFANMMMQAAAADAADPRKRIQVVRDHLAPGGKIRES